MVLTYRRRVRTFEDLPYELGLATYIELVFTLSMSVITISKVKLINSQKKSKHTSELTDHRKVPKWYLDPRPFANLSYPKPPRRAFHPILPSSNHPPRM